MLQETLRKKRSQFLFLSGEATGHPQGAFTIDRCIGRCPSRDSTALTRGPASPPSHTLQSPPQTQVQVALCKCVVEET